MSREASALVIGAGGYVGRNLCKALSVPYRETDSPMPVWEYGRAKREAELKVLDAGGTVVRNSLVYGFDLTGSAHG